ncbi:hypothetical protein [Actinoplanes aureus]|uniref:Uncharacterized protein n=1 Tax=Actinoplanes aureus TaxID=2792083 RepID=A0A931G7W3_9ACTN|nr:hypothetical protein [Actinoplanes aureus]MBG0568664.1 hypothetical protein [Actinoplanes aureus]
MTAAERSVTEVAAVAGDALRRLGLVDLADKVGGLQTFLAGGVVVAVAGEPDSGRTQIAAAIAAAQPAASVAEYEPGKIPQLPAWDLLVVTTPAVRALSRKEAVDLLDACSWRCPAALVVTRIDRASGADPCAELEEARLRPELAGSGVRWWFAGESGPAAEFATFIGQATDGDPAALHEAAARATLNRVLTEASGNRLDERLRQRDREVSAVRTAQRQLSLTVVNLGDAAGRVPLAVESAVRDLEGRLWLTADALARSALAWAAAGCQGDWADVTEPIRVGWQEFQESLDRVVPTARDQFRDGVDRFETELGKLQSQLDVRHEPPPLAWPGTWSSPELAERRAALASLDLEPVLARLRETCTNVADLLGEQPEPEPPKNTAGTMMMRRAPSALRRGKAILDKIEEMVERATADEPSDRISIQITHDLEALTKDRLARFAEVAAGLAEKAARADAAATGSVLQTRTAAIASAVDERNAWGSAYADVVSLLAWSRSW